MFKDRIDAGLQLAERLKYDEEAVVIGIPRGGVIVAHQIAHALGLPLGILVVKKISSPGNEDLAIGAATVDDVLINQQAGIPLSYIEEEIKKKQGEARKRLEFLGAAPLNVHNRVVILVDDGLATGLTMSLAVQVLQKQRPKKIVVAVPVASKQAIDLLKKMADEIVCLNVSDALFAIGEFYEDFAQVDECEVKQILQATKK